ncbi:MAG: hypothetical protein JNL59_10135, partial [Chitinophagaceae bacterium]|nr:hypothetical protein [Chitinophagaceae bacterium]
MPHEPFTGNDGSWIYDAADIANGNFFRIIRSDIHNHNFAEEDSFDLQLMEESFVASEYMDKQLARKMGKWQGYPSLDATYKDKNGRFYQVRFVIAGPHYYTLIACGKKNGPALDYFMRSFAIRPYQYPAAVKRVDTTLNFSVMSPVFPETAKEKMELPQYNYGYGGGDDDDEMERIMNGGVFKSKIIRNDTTGERIFVNFYKVGRYMEVEDTTVLEKEAIYPAGSDTTWIVRSKKKYDLPNGYRVWESQLSDTASSRLLWVKNYYRKGVGFGLSTELDTLSQPSGFLRNFFDSFTPSDTLTAYDPFTKKSKLFFDDFLKGDSTARKRAASGLSYLRVDSTDLPQLMQSIGSLSWSEKKYLDTKKELIGKLRRIQTPAATDALVKIYHAANDTLDIQLAALNSLVQQKTKYAIGRFRDIVTAEPPVLGAASNSWNEYGNYTLRNSIGGDRPYFGGNFMGNLYDSLQLTKTVLTDLLPLINLDDYKDVLMMLMAEMVDSSLLKPADYESYYSKFLLEAKQEVRKQAILEKQKSIKEAEKKRDDEGGNGYNRYNDDDKDPGNDDLQLYARLLMPFWESKPAVSTLMQQMLTSADKQLKYTTTLLLLRNKKSIPDTMLTYFAGLDDYRYDLYNGLKKIKQLDKFPARYNNHIELGRSKLISTASSYSKPDSVVYLSRLQAKVKGKKGYVYFFKYKKKKDDLTWYLGSVGLLPADEKKFAFADLEENEEENSEYAYYYDRSWNAQSPFRLSRLGTTRLKEDEPVAAQLAKELKRLIYSHRRSGRGFFDNETDSDSDEVVPVATDVEED